MKNKGLTISMIFQASSANYGSSFGNEAQLKKVTGADGNVYTYISRQALLYSLRSQMPKDELAPLSQDDKDKSVVQYDSAATIDKYPEIDLFGYMKTEKGSNGKKRAAVVRVSNAISLSPYSGDEDFLTNMGLANRLAAQIGKEVNNSIASSEITNSYYAYTVTVDLDQVGIDNNDGINLSSEEKAKRVISLINSLNNLYRDIRGRREDLHPIFSVGGIYSIKRPIYSNCLAVKNNRLNISKLDIAHDFNDNNNKTYFGLDLGHFDNDDEISQEFMPVSVDKFFKQLTDKVADYYAE